MKEARTWYTGIALVALAIIPGILLMSNYLLPEGAPAGAITTHAVKVDALQETPPAPADLRGGLEAMTGMAGGDAEVPQVYTILKVIYTENAGETIVSYSLFDGGYSASSTAAAAINAIDQGANLVYDQSSIPPSRSDTQVYYIVGFEGLSTLQDGKVTDLSGYAQWLSEHLSDQSRLYAALQRIKVVDLQAVQDVASSIFHSTIQDALEKYKMTKNLQDFLTIESELLDNPLFSDIPSTEKNRYRTVILQTWVHVWHSILQANVQDARYTVSDVLSQESSFSQKEYPAEMLGSTRDAILGYAHDYWMKKVIENLGVSFYLDKYQNWFSTSPNKFQGNAWNERRHNVFKLLIAGTEVKWNGDSPNRIETDTDLHTFTENAGTFGFLPHEYVPDEKNLFDHFLYAEEEKLNVHCDKTGGLYLPTERITAYLSDVDKALSISFFSSYKDDAMQRVNAVLYCALHQQQSYGTSTHVSIETTNAQWNSMIEGLHFNVLVAENLKFDRLTSGITYSSPEAPIFDYPDEPVIKDPVEPGVVPLIAIAPGAVVREPTTATTLTVPPHTLDTRPVEAVAATGTRPPAPSVPTVFTNPDTTPPPASPSACPLPSGSPPADEPGCIISTVSHIAIHDAAAEVTVQATEDGSQVVQSDDAVLFTVDPLPEEVTQFVIDARVLPSGAHIVIDAEADTVTIPLSSSVPVETGGAATETDAESTSAQSISLPISRRMDIEGSAADPTQIGIIYLYDGSSDGDYDPMFYLEPTSDASYTVSRTADGYAVTRTTPEGTPSLYRTGYRSAESNGGISITTAEPINTFSRMRGGTITTYTVDDKFIITYADSLESIWFNWALTAEGLWYYGYDNEGDAFFANPVKPTKHLHIADPALIFAESILLRLTKELPLEVAFPDGAVLEMQSPSVLFRGMDDQSQSDVQVVIDAQRQELSLDREAPPGHQLAAIPFHTDSFSLPLIEEQGGKVHLRTTPESQLINILLNGVPIKVENADIALEPATEVPALS